MARRASLIFPEDVYWKLKHRLVLPVVYKSKEEIETLFSKLSQGGKVTTPLKHEFFGIYGDLTDKFGINWMFQFA